MLIELFIFAVIIVAYGTFTTLALIGFGKLRREPFRHIPEHELPFISIVMSARNEELTIENCLHQLIKQNYPTDRFELIMMDDASEDRTYEMAQQVLHSCTINSKLIKQTQHYGKKYNISSAIEISAGSIIITTDADVVYRHKNWLKTIAAYFNAHKPEMLIMPVDFETQKGLLPAFQIFENIALTAISAGYTGITKAFMCNGANLAFRKKAYEAVNGYQSHLHITSGEDVFLLEDLKKINKHGIQYFLSRELIVKTSVQHTLSAFMNQRIRWAYKARYNSNLINTVAGLIIMLANLIFPVLLVAIIRQSAIIPYLSIFAIAKLIFDFLLLFLASDFLGRAKYIWLLVPFECVYWLYAIATGISSVFYKPTWKGKKVN